ncbi:MAG: hypothetical protein R6U19_01590 [Bacteroidales bacterium]
MGKIKINTCILCFILLLPTANAQVWSPFDIRGQASLRTTFCFDLGANSLNMGFVKASYRGGFLEEEVRSNALNALNTENNIAGIRGHTSFLLTIPIKESLWHWSLKGTAAQFRELSFSRSVFDLVFFGNEASLGQEYPFAMHYRNLHFQYLQAGLHYTHQRHIAGLAAGPVSGSYLFDLKLNNASIFTAADGSFIELKAQSKLHWSDTTESKSLWQGKGINATLYYGYQSNHQKAYLLLEDFGFLRFNTHISDDTDSSWHYNGVPLDLFGQETASFSVNQDSIQKWTGLSEAESHRLMLPSSLNLGFEQSIRDEHFTLGVYGKYYFYSFASPQITIVPGWKVHPNWKVFASVSSGGYDGLTSGLHLKGNINNELGLMIGSKGLSEIWFDQSPASAGFYLTLYAY